MASDTAAYQNIPRLPCIGRGLRYRLRPRLQADGGTTDSVPSSVPSTWGGRLGRLGRGQAGGWRHGYFKTCRRGRENTSLPYICDLRISQTGESSFRHRNEIVLHIDVPVITAPLIHSCRCTTSKVALLPHPGRRCSDADRLRCVR